jgi:hypothetical protein
MVVAESTSSTSAKAQAVKTALLDPEGPLFHQRHGKTGAFRMKQKHWRGFFRKVQLMLVAEG